jgi:hypothetical protein
MRVADIFVSYTSNDRDWAFWIAEELKGLGHMPHVHEWEVNAGDAIYAWMEARLDAADHVLCVVSDDYLKAPYSTRAQGDLAAARPLFAGRRGCEIASARSKSGRAAARSPWARSERALAICEKALGPNPSGYRADPSTKRRSAESNPLRRGCAITSCLPRQDG